LIFTAIADVPVTYSVCELLVSVVVGNGPMSVEIEIAVAKTIALDVGE
jgi:hypothetical protein